MARKMIQQRRDEGHSNATTAITAAAAAAGGSGPMLQPYFSCQTQIRPAPVAAPSTASKEAAAHQDFMVPLWPLL